MTIDAYTVADIRRAEQAVLEQQDPAALMMRAAHGLAQEILRLLRKSSSAPGRLAFGRGGPVARSAITGRRVVLLVGAGNNGGDVLFAGALLAGRGVQVRAQQVTDDVHEGGARALLRAGGRLERIFATEQESFSAEIDRAKLDAALETADICVDGIIGIGARGPLREPLDQVVTRLNAARETRADLLVVSADIPSGVSVSDGTVPGAAVNADVTVTFGVWKPALALPPAVASAGTVETVDLGLLPALRAAGAEPQVRRITAHDVAALWPTPKRNDHKYSRGVLGVVAGSVAYPGAAVLTVSGAFECGVGMLRYLGPIQSRDLVLTHRPEVVAGSGKCHSWVLGPGVAPDDLDQTNSITRIIETCADDGTPCVVDAGGLEFVPGHVEENIVLTPHAGELVRLLEERGERADLETVLSDPAYWALRAAKLTGATVLLKGSTTIVTRPSGEVLTHIAAPAWLATAGAGDVLSGVLGALLASSHERTRRDGNVMAELAAAASYVHGRAASRASQGGPVTALAVAGQISAAVREILSAPGTLES